MGNEPEECRMHTLAKSGVAHVQRCVHCNCVAIHCGPVTLRFDAAAAEALWNTLGQGLARLERELDTETFVKAMTPAGAHKPH